jgi:hypothetical protein
VVLSGTTRALPLAAEWSQAAAKSPALGDPGDQRSPRQSRPTPRGRRTAPSRGSFGARRQRGRGSRRARVGAAAVSSREGRAIAQEIPPPGPATAGAATTAGRGPGRGRGAGRARRYFQLRRRLRSHFVGSVRCA